MNTAINIWFSYRLCTSFFSTNSLSASRKRICCWATMKLVPLARFIPKQALMRNYPGGNASVRVWKCFPTVDFVPHEVTNLATRTSMNGSIFPPRVIKKKKTSTRTQDQCVIILKHRQETTTDTQRMVVVEKSKISTLRAYRRRWWQTLSVVKSIEFERSFKTILHQRHLKNWRYDLQRRSILLDNTTTLRLQNIPTDVHLRNSRF